MMADPDRSTPVIIDPAQPIQRTKRISKKLDAALRSIVFDAETIENAAILNGMTKRGLLAALRKPWVKARKRDIEQAHHSGLYVKSLNIGKKLMESGASEAVRLQAAQWVRAQTDPEAHKKGADTTKSLIIRLESGPIDGGRLITNQSSGVIQAIDVASEIVETSDK